MGCNGACVQLCATPTMLRINDWHAIFFVPETLCQKTL